MIRLIGFEYRKLFLKRSIFIAILLFSIIDIIKIGSVYQQNSLFAYESTSKWESIYWEVYDDFSGKITNEKIDKLLEIYRPLEQKTADRTASTRTDNPNTFTGNVYSDYHLFKWCYIQPMEYTYMYQSTANDIVRNAIGNMKFYKNLGNDYEYKKNNIIANLFAGRKISDFEYIEMYQYYVHYDFSILLILFICLYGIVNVFVSDKETEMDSIILTTIQGGIRSTTAKIISTLLFITVICLWFLMLDFIVFSIYFHTFEGASLPVYAIQNFVASSVNIALWQYTIVSILLKTLGMLVLGMIFLLISEFFKNALLPFILSLILTFVLLFFKERYLGSGYIIKKIVNPFFLLYNRELFGKTEFINIFGCPVLSYIGAIIFSFLLMIIIIVFIYLFSKVNYVCKNKGGLSCR